MMHTTFLVAKKMSSDILMSNKLGDNRISLGSQLLGKDFLLT